MLWGRGGGFKQTADPENLGRAWFLHPGEVDSLYLHVAIPAAGGIYDIGRVDLMAYVVTMGTTVRGRFKNRGGIEFENELRSHVPGMGLSRVCTDSIGRWS